MAFHAQQEIGDFPGATQIVAGLATIAVTTVGGLAAFANPVLGLLVGWLGAAAACGVVLAAVGDSRARRAAVAMVVVLPATAVLEPVLLLPLWSGGGLWLVGGLGLLVTGLTPTLAIALAGRRRETVEAVAAGGSTCLRLGFAACTIAVVVTGHVVFQLARPSERLDEGFFAVLLLDLLPAGIYLIGTRRPKTVLVTGFLLFAVVAAGWALFKIEEGNQFAGIWVIYSWTLAVAVATAGAMHDYVRR